MESGLKALARLLGSERELRVGLTVTPNRRAEASGTTTRAEDRRWVRDAKGGQPEKVPGAFGGSAFGTAGPARTRATDPAEL